MTNTEFINLHSAAALENYAAQHPDFTALCNMLSHVCASYKAPSIFLDYSGKENPEYLTTTPPVIVIAKTRNNYNKTRLDFSLLKIESQHESADGVIIKGKYDSIPCRLVVCS